MTVPPEYLDFLESDRVSEPTRTVLFERMAGPEPAPGLFTPMQEETLRALIARIIPQGTDQVEIAGTIMARLAAGKGDGWRFDALPPDAEAYAQALDHLAAHDLAALEPAEQDALIATLAEPKGSAQARWFEELRGDAVTAYVAHPATLARFGYSGFGVGGAHTPHHGFVTLGPNEREAWEPLPIEPEALRTETKA